MQFSWFVILFEKLFCTYYLYFSKNFIIVQWKLYKFKFTYTNHFQSLIILIIIKECLIYIVINLLNFLNYFIVKKNSKYFTNISIILKTSTSNFFDFFDMKPFGRRYILISRYFVNLPSLLPKKHLFFQWKMKRLRPTSMEALPLIWQMYFLTRREKENSFVSKCNSNFFSHAKVILLAEYPLWNNVKLSWFL